MTLYFVVRTDVSRESGQQRTFYTEDSRERADERLAYIKTVHVGTFEVFVGKIGD